jgi:hypothetical protein
VGLPQWHSGAHALGSRVVAGRMYHASLRGKSTHNHRSLPQQGIKTLFNRSEKSIHINVKNDSRHPSPSLKILNIRSLLVYKRSAQKSSLFSKNWLFGVGLFFAELFFQGNSLWHCRFRNFTLTSTAYSAILRNMY